MRVAEIKAALAVNVEAERKLAQLNEEMQGLARTIRTKDQAIQESSVKIELMERRMEAAKKQADALVDLENELAKMKKQERSYEEAIEQLQTDLDTAEQENAKLKVAIAGQEQKSGFNSTSILDRIGTDRAIYFDAASPATGTQPVDQPDSVPVEGSLETSYLLEQVSLSPTPLILFALADSTSPTDRRTPGHGQVPPKREQLPQGPGPHPRNRSPLSTPNSQRTPPRPAASRPPYHFRHLRVRVR